MSFRYGFYNAQNGDRTYDATDMSALFDGIINDGVFASYGHAFQTIPGEGLGVIVQTGRAWYDHTWNWLDANLALPLGTASTMYARYDAIVLETNSTSRSNEIKVVPGTAQTTPVKPTLTANQHALAYVKVEAGATSILQADIEYVPGTEGNPFVSGVLSVIDSSNILAQWNSQFDTWFQNLHYILDGDVAGHLQNEIEDLQDFREEFDEHGNYQLLDVKQSYRQTLGEKWLVCNGASVSANDYPKFVFEYSRQAGAPLKPTTGSPLLYVSTEVKHQMVAADEENNLLYVAEYDAADGVSTYRVRAYDVANDRLVEHSAYRRDSAGTIFTMVYDKNTHKLVALRGSMPSSPSLVMWNATDPSDPLFTLPFSSGQATNCVLRTLGNGTVYESLYNSGNWNMVGSVDLQTKVAGTTRNITTNLTNLKVVQCPLSVDTDRGYFIAIGENYSSQGEDTAIYAAIFDANLDKLYEIPILKASDILGSISPALTYSYSQLAIECEYGYVLISGKVMNTAFATALRIAVGQSGASVEMLYKKAFDSLDWSTSFTRRQSIVKDANGGVWIGLYAYSNSQYASSFSVGVFRRSIGDVVDAIGTFDRYEFLRAINGVALYYDAYSSPISIGYASFNDIRTNLPNPTYGGTYQTSGLPNTFIRVKE